jgi:hypothetical protein
MTVTKNTLHGESKKRTAIWLTPSMLEYIDYLAAAKGYSRSELLEQAARQHILEQVKTFPDASVKLNLDNSYHPEFVID